MLRAYGSAYSSPMAGSMGSMGSMGPINGTMNSIQSAVATAGNAAMMASMYDQVSNFELTGLRAFIGCLKKRAFVP